MYTAVLIYHRSVVTVTETVETVGTELRRTFTIGNHSLPSEARSSPSHELPAGSELKHAHWRDLDPLPRWQHLAIGVYMLLLAVTAIVGNLLVVWACVRYRTLRTSSNLLVVNLAVGDLLMCTVDFPLFVTASFLQQWPFGKTMCQTYGVLTAAAGLVTINTLAVISLDRYRAVTHRLTTHPRGPSRFTLLAVLGVWLYSLAWALAPVLGWGSYVLDGIGTTCTFDFFTRTRGNVSFILSVTIGNFVLPLSLILFSYSGIWLTVRSTHCSLRQTSAIVSVGARRRRGPGRFQADLKTAGIILGIVLAFLLTWTPFLVVCLLGLFGQGGAAEVTVMTSVLPSVVAKTSTALNPVLYSISHPKVRRKLLVLVSCLPGARRCYSQAPTSSFFSSSVVTNNSWTVNRGS
ncbi:rhodopsin-like [Babylonia areolata]|uniref:rhodopsin-like n=1 Tax=Babylonia areolata TaxID=304850 RepID=UPI003FD6651F